MKFTKLLTFLLILGLIFAVATGCDSEEDSESSSESSTISEAEYPVTVNGYTVTSRPQRIVSLSPAITEKIYDLGLVQRLVGVSDFCDYPPQAEALERCGTAHTLNLDVIEALDVHLILAEAELAEDDMIRLQQIDVDVVVINHAQTLDELWENYRSICRLLEGENTGGEIGDTFTQRIDSSLDELKAACTAANGGTPSPALYLRLMDYTVATGDTLESELMALLGLKNIAQDQTSWNYPAELADDAGRVDFEAIEHIFMDESNVTIKMLEQSAYYKSLQATLKDWYLYINMSLFERQSLRMLPELWRMAEYLYPEAQLPTVPQGNLAELEDSGDLSEEDDPEADEQDTQSDDTETE